MPCSATVTTDCLPQERVPLDPEDDDEIAFASARADRYYGDNSLLDRRGRLGGRHRPGLPDRHRPRPAGRRRAALGARQLLDPALDALRARPTRARRRSRPRSRPASTSRSTRRPGAASCRATGASLNDHLRLVAGATYEDKRIDSADQDARAAAAPLRQGPRQRQAAAPDADVRADRQSKLDARSTPSSTGRRPTTSSWSSPAATTTRRCTSRSTRPRRRWSGRLTPAITRSA